MLRKVGDASRTIRLVLALSLSLASALAAASVHAQEVTKEDMLGLDAQVQDIKSDVIGIAAELQGLEEKLLYPSSTQVAVFVALEGTPDFRLDSLQIVLDGAPVARHIYSAAELEALRKGGVQHIYTGNVGVGEHRLEVSLAGKQADGGDLAEAETLTFTKSVGPDVLGVTLSQGAGGARIALGGW